MSQPLLNVADLTITTRAGAVLVDRLNLDISRGETVGLVGESGSGKSLTARAIARLMPSTLNATGSVILDNVDVLALRGNALRRTRGSKMSMIFQDPRAHVDPLWRIGDHLTTPLRKGHGLNRSAAHGRAVSLLRDVGIREPERVINQHPDQISGGMLQRVVIAGALAAEPELLIADEPTTALDVTTQAEIVRTIAKLRRQRQLATLFITHDLDLAATICHRVIVLYAGRTAESGSVTTVFAAPLHPYTQGLLAARPRLDGPRTALQAIAGTPISGADAPSGCAFAARCPHMVPAVCEQHTPPLYAHGGRLVACHRVEELADAS